MIVSVEQLTARHHDWTEHSEYWRDIALLYRGGPAIRREAARFLIARPVEPREVYAQRCARMTYQNILATAIGWYLSALFEPGPQVQLAGASPGTQAYLERFISDADAGGTPLTDLARRWFERVVLDGAVYVLLDLPPAGGRAYESRLAQQRSGALDAFAVTYTAQQVTNWGTDRRGNLDWILISTEEHSGTLDTDERRDRWYYFDRQNFTIYEGARDDDKRHVLVVAQGRHALADQGRVPVRRIAVPDSLWLAYRVYPQILDHLNEENGLGWKLLMSNLAVPVITGEYEQPPKLSETAYIHLGKGGTFSWSEPSGGTISTSAERLASIRQEIYRAMYLQAQGRDASATASASSGYSKELDMMPAADVLNQFGGIFRRELAAILADVALIRGEPNVAIHVEGMTYEDPDDLGEIRDGLDMGIPSETLRRLLHRRAARCLARGAPKDELERIEAEIDAAPGPEERARRLFEQE